MREWRFFLTLSVYMIYLYHNKKPKRRVEMIKGARKSELKVRWIVLGEIAVIKTHTCEDVEVMFKFRSELYLRELRGELVIID